KIFKIDGGSAQSLVTNSRPITTQISLFNKYHPLMSDDQVRRVLTTLPEPFSEIRTGFHSPRLENNPENEVLVRWLDSRNIISSWSEGGYFANHLIKVNLYRRG